MISLSHIFYTLKILFGAGLFVYIASIIDWSDAAQKLSNMPVSTVLIGIVIVLLQAIILGWRWQCIGALEKIRLPVRSYTVATLSSFFFSQGLPASLGADAFRIWWYSRRGIGATTGLKVITFDRVIGLISLAFVCIASVIILISQSGNSLAINSLIVCICLACVGFVFLISPMKTGIAVLFLKVLKNFPPFVQKTLAWLMDLRDLFRVGSVFQTSLILVLGVTVHLMTVLLGYILANGLGAEINFLQCLAAIAPGLFISYLPISIAGWGVREASFVLAFSLVGVSSEIALLVSLGIGVIVLMVALMGGLIWAASGMRHLYMQDVQMQKIKDEVSA